MKINVITRCTRTHLLRKVEKSLIDSFDSVRSVGFDLNWIIIVDTSSVYRLDSEFLENFSKYSLRFEKGKKGDMGHSLINNVLEEIPSYEWVYILDDDNEMHPSLLPEFFEKIKDRNFSGFIFSQHVGGRDFTKLEIREAKPDNVKVQKIDMAQFLLKKSLIGKKRFQPMTYVADGIFIEELHKENPDEFVFSSKVLCYYNSLQTLPKSGSLPKVVSLGTDIILKSIKGSNSESNELFQEKVTDEEAIEKIVNLDPDCILTVGDSYKLFPSLSSLSADFRKRWIHLPDGIGAGEASYSCAMNYILKSVENDIVSVFTPIYNTGEKILRTYKSLLSQTFTDWEWVVVNDSDNLETLKILEKIKDPRVKIYDFQKKSGGNIGEAKYRACALSRGKYLVELDHDDYLLPHALHDVVNGFEKYPDAGFLYTDCVEVDEQLQSLTYGETFAFGYGSYRKETHLGIEFLVADTPNINPVTIRHIVSVPNHLRAWRRNVYFQIGGHNRRLAIADDYELIVRTFLVTKIVKIEKACYLQYHHGNNTQISTRGDIQRRVRTVSNFYNEHIKKRFEELGKEDWAFGKNLLSLEHRNKEEENYVNYII